MFSSSTAHTKKANTSSRHGSSTNVDTAAHGFLKLWQIISRHPCIVASVILMMSMVLFLTLNVNGHWDFALPLRSKKLLTLLVVSYAIGVSTLLFQTLTHNPILTPSLLGFDSLYILLQSLLVFFLGAISFASIDPIAKFMLEVILMFGASILLFRLLFSKKKQDLTRLILVGVIFGVLFRSLSALISRLISPDDFVVVQSVSYAQFNTVNPQLLTISLLICAVSAIAIWRWRYQCDVLMLGKSQALNLGIDYQRLAFGFWLVDRDRRISRDCNGVSRTCDIFWITCLCLNQSIS